MIILNQIIKTMRNYATWIQTALLFIFKLKMFIKTLQIMLEKDLTHQIMKFRDHCQKGMNKKVIGLMKDELGGKIITEFVALRPKTDSYLTDGDTVHKKAKGTKKCVKKRILKFNDYKKCLFEKKKQYYNCNKNLKVKHIMYTLKKLTRLH